MTHLLPALDVPTRYRTSEESGLQMDLHTTPSSSALLCSAIRVDAPETNSLSCAAAGIIAPLSATTEALIPHEKLREAATPDSALLAQARPPAQPVLADKPMSEISELLCQRFKNNFIKLHTIPNRTKFIPFSTRNILTGMLCSTSDVVSQLKKRLNHFFLREINQLNAFGCLILPINIFNPGLKLSQLIFCLARRCQLKKPVNSHARSPCNLSNSGDYNTVLFEPIFRLFHLLLTRNSSSSPNSSDRTESLHPSRSIIFIQIGKTQPHREKKRRSPKRRYEEHLYHRFRVESYSLRQHYNFLNVLKFDDVVLRNRKAYRGQA